MFVLLQVLVVAYRTSVPLRHQAARACADRYEDYFGAFTSGVDLLNKGKAASAADALRQSLSLNPTPDAFSAYIATADLLFENGDYSMASSCYRHSLTLNTLVDADDVGLRERLAASLRGMGHVREAAALLHETLGSVPEQEAETRSWLWLDLGSMIEEIAPVPGTGPEYPVTRLDELPSVWLGAGPRRESLTAAACYRRAIDGVTVAGCGDSSSGEDPSEGGIRSGMSDDSLRSSASVSRQDSGHELRGEAHKRLADVLVAAHGAAAGASPFATAAALLPNDICCATHVQYGLGVSCDMRQALPLPPAQSVIPTLPDRNLGSGSAIPAMPAPATWLASPSLAALAVEPTGNGWEARAGLTFEREGAVVLPRLISAASIETLKAAVEAAIRPCEEMEEASHDLTAETREAAYRTHRALPIGKGHAREPIDSICRTLYPLLASILQLSDGASLPLIGCGFMAIEPGARAQELHKDVHGHDRHESLHGHPAGGSPRAVSIQIQLTDTTDDVDADVGGAGRVEDLVDGGHVGGEGAAHSHSQLSRGSLEVLPASHRPDAANGLPDRISMAIESGEATDGAIVPIAVPAGTVSLYSSRLWHRGGANRSERRRIFCFLTVMEPHSPAPPGLIHTMRREEVGLWAIDEHGLAAGCVGAK